MEKFTGKIDSQMLLQQCMTIAKKKNIRQNSALFISKLMWKKWKKYAKSFCESEDRDFRENPVSHEMEIIAIISWLFGAFLRKMSRNKRLSLSTLQSVATLYCSSWFTDRSLWSTFRVGVGRGVSGSHVTEVRTALLEAAVHPILHTRHLKFLTLIRAAGGVYDFRNFEEV